MDRRAFLSAFTCAGLVWRGGRVQAQSRPKRIGVLLAGSRERWIELGSDTSFLAGMREAGYVEGRDFVIVGRFADGQYDRLPRMARELVELQVDIILAGPSPAIRAAKAATATIPIVFPGTGDPVGAGFAETLARPGGNLTGLSNSNVDISAKLLELLKAMAPATQRVAVLANPGSSSEPAMSRNIDAVAPALGLSTFVVEARSTDEIARGFETMRQQGADALLIAADGLLSMQGRQIAALATQYRLPSITQSSSYVRMGGLMSYSMGPGAWRRSATYVDKIFKGAKPGDLPIEQPQFLRLFINQKTAKALGLEIPASLRLRAEEVIE